MKFRFSISLFLLTAFMMQYFSGAYVVADYYLHEVYYARHCENKGLPQMHCNGKCQMMKRLRKIESPENPNLPQKINVKVDPFYFTQTAIRIQASGLTKSIFPQNVDRFITSPALSGVFHPPPPRA